MKSSEHNCLAVNNESQKMVLKLQELCRVVIIHSLKNQELNDFDSKMRKEVQTKVKQDLKECMPSPVETSVIMKDSGYSIETGVLDKIKLTKNNVPQSQIVNCMGNTHVDDKTNQVTIKQEVDDIGSFKENQNLVRKVVADFVDSKRGIKEEFVKETGEICNSVKSVGSNNGIKLSNQVDTIEGNEVSHIIPLKTQDQLCKEMKCENTNSDNVDRSGSAFITEKNVPSCDLQNHYRTGENSSPSHSREQYTGSQNRIPVNVGVVKDVHYNDGLQRTGKRKLSSYSITSGTDDVTDISDSSGIDEKTVDCGNDKLYPVMFNTEFALNSHYSPLLRSFPTENGDWGQNSPLSNMNRSPGVCYNPQHDFSVDNEGTIIRNYQNKNSTISQSNGKNTLKWGCNEVSSVSESPAPLLYSELSMRPSKEMPPEQILTCSCDGCVTTRTTVMQGCDKCDKMPFLNDFGIKKISENFNSNGDELFRRIEESLAETETLKSQEEELLKRIARSLNEAESLKCREEELLKKIERSLTEAETLKSREEELLRRIEVSLAHTGSVKSQDEELLMRIEASLKNAQYDECSELESKHQADLDLSLPLKKRKKRLKLLTQSEEVKLKLQERNLPVENFPSYPSKRMISIAELLPTYNKLQNPPCISPIQTGGLKLDSQTNSLQSENSPSYPLMPGVSIAEFDTHHNVPLFDKVRRPSSTSSGFFSDESLLHNEVDADRKYTSALDHNVKNAGSEPIITCKTEENSACCSFENGVTSEIPFIQDRLYLPYKDQIKDENVVIAEHGKYQNRTSEQGIALSAYDSIETTEDVVGMDSFKEHEPKKNSSIGMKEAITLEHNINDAKVYSNYNTQSSESGEYVKMNSTDLDEMDYKGSEKFKVETGSVNCKHIKKEIVSTE